jgi:hypothetical protein
MMEQAAGLSVKRSRLRVASLHKSSDILRRDVILFIHCQIHHNKTERGSEVEVKRTGIL